MAAQTEVVFPRSLSNLYPVEAQKIYIETYKQSMAIHAAETKNGLSVESMASRDAWDAVQREFVQDPVTHKFHRVGEQVVDTSQTDKRSLLDKVKGLFNKK
jgi:cation transport regulator ChaB